MLYISKILMLFIMANMLIVFISMVDIQYHERFYSMFCILPSGGTACIGGTASM